MYRSMWGAAKFHSNQQQPRYMWHHSLEKCPLSPKLLCVWYTILHVKLALQHEALTLSPAVLSTSFRGALSVMNNSFPGTLVVITRDALESAFKLTRAVVLVTADVVERDVDVAVLVLVFVLKELDVELDGDVVLLLLVQRMWP